MILFHITSRSEWDAAQPIGEYRPQAFAREGFIHCSYAHQVLAVANRFYKGVPELVLLAIDPERLACRIVDENLEGGSQLFPHAYGPLPVAAVRDVYSFPCGPDGTFSRQMASMVGLDVGSSLTTF